MKKMSMLLAVLLCVCFTPSFTAAAGETVAAKTTQQSFQKVTMVDAEVLATATVKQSLADTHKGSCTVEKGVAVKVLGKIGDFYTVYVPSHNCVGFTEAKLLKTASPVVTEGTTQQDKVATNSVKPTASTQPSSKSVPAATATPQSGVSLEEQKMLDLINKARLDAGLNKVDFDMELMKTARLKAKDMVLNEYFEHQSPTYGSPFDMMRKYGLKFNSAAEVIAGNKTQEAAFKAWMGDPQHKANILNSKFTYVGVGIADSTKYGKIYVDEFIAR